MLIITYKKHFIRLSHVWFPDNSTPFNIQEFDVGDVVFVHGASIQPVGGKLYTLQSTLIKDLTLSEEQLFLTLGKHLRQYIKRSIKEGNANVCFYRSEDILKDPRILVQCKTLYEKMFSDKGMNSKFNISLAKKYCNQNSLLIGMAYISDKPIGFSAVIFKDKNARLWLSAFDFRNSKEDDQVLSRAHQQLDWKLLLECKKYGVEQFDFGGVNSFSEPNGIAQFKLNFEREGKVNYGNYLIPKNILGRIAINLFGL